MRESIEFIGPGGSKNNPNQKASEGPVVLTVLAAVDTKSGKETEQAGKEISIQTKVYTIRYNATAEDYTLSIRYRSELYDIVDIADKYGDKSFLEIQATRRK